MNQFFYTIFIVVLKVFVSLQKQIITFKTKVYDKISTRYITCYFHDGCSQFCKGRLYARDRTH